MITTPIARRYAKALFESINDDDIVPVRQALTACASACEQSAALRSVFASPLYAFDEKREVLSALTARVGCPSILAKLLLYALQHNRMIFIREISAAFAALADRAAGRLSMTVVSSHALTDAQKKSVKARLEEATRCDVRVSYAVDPALIGGVVVSIGGRVFDGSIKTQLSQWKAALIQE